MPPTQAHWSLLVCFLDIALAGLLCSLAQMCSLEIQLLHALETALQFPWQFCSTCMTAIRFSIGHASTKVWNAGHSPLTNGCRYFAMRTQTSLLVHFAAAVARHWTLPPS